MNKHFFVLLPRMLLLVLFGLISRQTANAQGQEGVTVDMSLIDGMELTPANIFSYRLQQQGSQTKTYLVKGSLIYRKQALSMNYEYRITLQPGITQITPDMIGTPTWTFSSPALRELFQNYNKLPQGTYEYCVSLLPLGTSPDPVGEKPPSSCVYQTVDDLFLINLITPDNDAKIYEFNPMLAWVVNYPFASELTYRLRVAELKQGQNPQNAITRNNPMYQESNVASTGIIYPVSARPLQKWQPYVWTVDAYYKGILLGGAEVWKFTIVDDSELVAAKVEQSYYEFEKHYGETEIPAPGRLRLKFVCNVATDTLTMSIINKNGEFTQFRERRFPVVVGDNRIDIDLLTASFSHKGHYDVIITTSDDRRFIVPTIYLNPLFIQPQK